MLFEKIWLTRRLLLPIVKAKSKSIRKIRKKTYTTKAAFERYLRAMKRSLSKADFYCLGILPSNSDYEAIVPGVTNNVAAYNAILESIFAEKYISLDDLNRRGIMSDHIHLNRDGHFDIYERLMLRTVDNA
jgi:hypothetical protein